MHRNTKGKFLLLFLIACFGFNIPAIAQPVYQDITDSIPLVHTYGPQGIINELGGGVSFRDFNMDGYDDLSFPSRAGDSLYIYQNDGVGSFNRVVVLPTGSDTMEIKNVLWVDIDNDGDRDLFLTIYGAPDKLFLNDNGTFIDISSTAGLNSGSILSFAAACADYDLDGYVIFLLPTEIFLRLISVIIYIATTAI